MLLDSFDLSLDHLPNIGAYVETLATGKLLADSQKRNQNDQGQQNDSTTDATVAKQGQQNDSTTDATVAKQGQQNDSTTDDTFAKQGLPALSIVDAFVSESNPKANQTSASSQSSDHHWYTGALHVGEDLALGAVDEVVNHPGRVLESAAIGVVTGVAVGFLAPEVAVAAGVVGAGYAGYKLYKNAGTWIHAAEVVASPQGHSTEEQTQAKNSLESVGGGVVDLAAGFAGFSAGRAIQMAMVAGASAADGAAQTSLDKTTPQEQPLDRAPIQTSDLAKVQAASTAGDATESTTASQMQGRTIEERATIINRLATGKVEGIETGQDQGLAKQITFAKVVGDDGQSTDVIVRKIDPADTLDLSRIRQAQIQATVDSLTGVDSGAPESAMRQIVIDGKPQWVALQENAGKSLGAKLSDWAATEYGHADEKGMVPLEDLTKLLEAHPALKESIGKGFLQTLYQGNPDLLNLSNLAVRGSQAGEVPLDEPMQIPIIDAKYNWFPGQDAAQGAANPVYPAPNWGENAGVGNAPPVIQLYAGKQLSEISPLLQQRAEGIQQIFESPQGQADLLKAGLSSNEIAAATSRLQYLTTKGFPPLYTMWDPEWSTVSAPEFESAIGYAAARSAPLTLNDVLAGQQIQLH